MGGIIGIGFTKIMGEKSGAPTPGMEIKNNLSLIGVEKTKVEFGDSKSGFARVSFAMDINYNKTGKINIIGEIVYKDAPEVIEEMVKEFEKSKRLPISLSEPILNFIFTKAILKALNVADELGLPSPVMLPRVKLSNQK